MLGEILRIAETMRKTVGRRDGEKLSSWLMQPNLDF